MPYIVVALGILVSAIGAYAMYSGFRIVEIERGWATAIVGSVLFSGGLVTTVIGLAIRTLEKLKILLRTERVAVASSTAPPPPHAVAEVRPSADALPPYGIDATGTDASPAAAAILSTHTSRPAVRGSKTTEIDRLPHREQGLISPDMVEAILAADGKHRKDPQSEDQEWKSFDELPYDDDAPESDDHDAVLGHSDKSAAADDNAMDSWLEDSFVDLDETESSGSPAPVVPAGGAPHDLLIEELRPEAGRDVPHSDAEAIARPTDAEPHLDPAASPTPSSPPREAAQPAVIGRYESEGTSYVMYADGSIEAQSEAGVYRFASMAELKAFIEG